jgi:hypothetical protein
MDRRKSIKFEGIIVDYPDDMTPRKLTEILTDLIEKVRREPDEPRQDEAASTLGLREALNKKRDLPP